MKTWVLTIMLLPYLAFGIGTNQPASAPVNSAGFYTFDDVMGYTKQKFFLDFTGPGLGGVVRYGPSVNSFDWADLSVSAGFSDKKKFRLGLRIRQYRFFQILYLTNRIDQDAVSVDGFCRFMTAPPNGSEWNTGLDGPVFPGRGQTWNSLDLRFDQKATLVNPNRSVSFSTQNIQNGTNFGYYSDESFWWNGPRLILNNSFRFGLDSHLNLGLDLNVRCLPFNSSFRGKYESWNTFSISNGWHSSRIVLTNRNLKMKTNLFGVGLSAIVEWGIRPDWRGSITAGVTASPAETFPAHMGWTIGLSTTWDSGNDRYSRTSRIKHLRYPSWPDFLNPGHFRIKGRLGFSGFKADRNLRLEADIFYGILDGLTVHSAVGGQAWVNSRTRSSSVFFDVNGSLGVFFTTDRGKDFLAEGNRSFYLLPAWKILLSLDQSVNFSFSVPRDKNSYFSPGYNWEASLSLGIFDWLNFKLGILPFFPLEKNGSFSLSAIAVIADIIPVNVSWQPERFFAFSAGFRY